MPKKPETLFKEKILPQLRSLPNSWWLKTQMICIRGIPDILGCVNGHFIALELKTDDKNSKLAPLQGYILRKITGAGGLAIEVTPSMWEDTFEVLKKLAFAQATYKASPRPKFQELDS